MGLHREAVAGKLRRLTFINRHLRTIAVRPGTSNLSTQPTDIDRMEERVIVDSNFSAIISVPFEGIDIPAWSFSLPDEVGDVRSGSVKRIASTVEWSICVQFVHRALREISVPARQMAAA